MLLRQTSLLGVFALDPERKADERGYFARTYDAAWFVEQGMDPAIGECSVSFNSRRGTLRGMHFQRAPHEEVKLVRCVRGSLFDVVVDLRAGSPTLGGWTAQALSQQNGCALYIPKGCAHGFITLEDNTEVHYQISTAFAPSHAAGVRWDDPAFAIDWPILPVVVAARDREFPDFKT
jgi:dTDP-4-dehydrorhamnose 3,5-epimerase